MNLDAGILTNIMNDFGGMFRLGVGYLSGEARWLLGTLMVIDCALFGLFYALGNNNVANAVKRLMKYGAFIFIVTEFKFLANTVLNSFIYIGIKGGGSNINPSAIKDPSAISEMGFVVAQPIFDHMSNYSGFDVMQNLHTIMMSGLTGMLIVLAFAVIGIQILITYVEFYIFAVLALVLIPFSVWRPVSWLGEKAIGGVIAYGIKLGVLTLLSSAIIPMVSNWKLPPDPTFYQALYALIGAFALTFLVWQAPNGIASQLGGSPVLSASAVAGTAMSAGMGMVGAGMMTRAATGGVVSAGVAATRAAAAGISAGVTAGSPGAALSGAAVTRAATAVPEAAARAGNSRPSTGSARPAVAPGEKPTAANNPGAAPNWASAMQTGEKPTAASNPGATPDWANALQMAQSSIPQESAGGGGTSATIQSDE